MDGTSSSGGGSDGSMTSGDSGDGLGKQCTSTGQCTAGQTCVDGVCCESACDGVCESCNQPNAAGHCNPIPTMTDPDKECVLMPLPDAGTAVADAGVAEAGTDAQAGDAGGAGDAGEAGAVADAASEASMEIDGGVPEAGVTFNQPDAGIVTTLAPCAGSCNGARACVYPTQTTSCGTQFCNTPTQVGGFGCDGTGRCGPTLGDCQSYACESVDGGTAAVGACATSCSVESDCAPSAFCNGQTCEPKKGDGVPCTTPNQCGSGFCVTNGPSSVCCNQACDPSVVTGGTCSASGNVGTCTCPQCTGAGNSCVLWYRDFDSDTFGDKFGSISTNPPTAEVGCSNETPTSGWVANNTDCDDHDLNVNPDQAGYFPYPSAGNGTYDYNCDGTLEKQTTEEIGASCGLCENNSGCGNGNACGTSTSTTALTCSSSIFCVIGRLPVETLASVTIDAVPISPISPVEPVEPIGPIETYCCAGVTSAITSFNGHSVTGPNGSCGVTGTETTCGACNGSGGFTTTPSSVTQACH